MARVWRGEVTAIRSLILSSYTTHADRVYRAGVTKGVAGVEAELKALANEVLRELADPTRAMPGEQPDGTVKKKPASNRKRKKAE